MRSKSIALLTIAAAASLLAGCATLPAGTEGTATPAASAPAELETTQVVEASFEQPANVGERFGADGVALEVWSGIAPDESAPAALGELAEGNVWVTTHTAQWVAEPIDTNFDVAPVLRSTTDESLTFEAVSPREAGIPMTAEKLYTFPWYFQVPAHLADAESLVLCVTADGACSLITG